MAETDSTDIVEMLLAEHRSLKQLFGEFDVALASDEREAWFRNLTAALVRHEVAEEETIYPLLGDQGPEGAAQVETRIREQSEAEELLQSLERVDVMSATFTDGIRDLEGAVLDHAGKEEAEVFPLISRSTSPEDRSRLGQRYERAKTRAPTHAHPHTPDLPPLSRVVGPVIALADRVRDAFRGGPEGSGSGSPGITRHG